MNETIKLTSSLALAAAAENDPARAKGFPLRERERRRRRREESANPSTGNEGGTRKRTTHLEKCFFLVPASLAVQGDIMLSVGETMEGFLQEMKTKRKEGRWVSDRRPFRSSFTQHSLPSSRWCRGKDSKSDLPRSHPLHEKSLLSSAHLVSHGDGGGSVSFLKGREGRRRRRGESVWDALNRSKKGFWRVLVDGSGAEDGRKTEEREREVRGSIEWEGNKGC